MKKIDDIADFIEINNISRNIIREFENIKEVFLAQNSFMFITKEECVNYCLNVIKNSEKDIEELKIALKNLKEKYK